MRPYDNRDPHELWLRHFAPLFSVGTWDALSSGKDAATGGPATFTLRLLGRQATMRPYGTGLPGDPAGWRVEVDWGVWKWDGETAVASGLCHAVRLLATAAVWQCHSDALEGE